MSVKVKIDKKAAATALVALLFVSVVLYWFFFRSDTLPEGIVSANGRIEATEYDIAPKQGGRLDSVFVREGDMVSAGGTLALMDQADLLATLEESEAQIRLSESRRNQASAALMQQQAESRLARKDYARYSKLLAQDVISRQQFDQARAKMESLEAAVKATGAQLTEAGSGIEAIRAKTRVVKNNLEECRLKTPVDGRVLYRLAEPGEVLPPGGKVVTVLDLTDVYMTVFLPSEMAGRLVVGSEARIVLDAFPEWVIPARISFVASRAQFTPKEVETRSERDKLMFRVKLQIDPELLRTRLRNIKTGLTGEGYVRLSQDTEWPEKLRVRLS